MYYHSLMKQKCYPLKPEQHIWGLLEGDEVHSNFRFCDDMLAKECQMPASLTIEQIEWINY